MKISPNLPEVAWYTSYKSAFNLLHCLMWNLIWNPSSGKRSHASFLVSLNACLILVCGTLLWLREQTHFYFLFCPGFHGPWLWMLTRTFKKDANPLNSAGSTADVCCMYGLKHNSAWKYCKLLWAFSYFRASWGSLVPDTLTHVRAWAQLKNCLKDAGISLPFLHEGESRSGNYQSKVHGCCTFKIIIKLVWLEQLKSLATIWAWKCRHVVICDGISDKWSAVYRISLRWTSDLCEKTVFDMLRTERCFNDPLSRDEHTYNKTKQNWNGAKLPPSTTTPTEVCFWSSTMIVLIKLYCMCTSYQLQWTVTVGQIQSRQAVGLTQEIVQILERFFKN